MFESRMNQVSDLFSRDYNGKATVAYHGSNNPKETYITDSDLPNFRNMINIEKTLSNNISTLERKAQNSYSLDPRIYELEKNAEETYVKWKNEQEKVNERKEREKVLKDSFTRLQSEKEQLQKQLRNYEKQNQEETNGNYYQSKYSLSASKYDHLERSPEQYREGESTRMEGLRQTNKTTKTVRFYDTFEREDCAKSSLGFTKTLKANNDDFNFHQAEMKTTMSSPWKNFHYHDNLVNYANVDVEKLEAASKHCAACEKKYKLILNMVNPYKEKQRITDETIRKILIQLKGLFMSKKLKEAEELVENTLHDGYKHADLYYMGGEVKKALNLYKEAEAYYLQALTFQVHSPYIYQSLGLVYINLNSHKRAIPLLKHFTDKIVSDSANFELGKCLALTKSYLEATVCFGKAIEINPKQADYYLHRGDSFEALGFTKLAVDDYRMFRKLAPNYRGVFESKIKALEKQGDYEEANSFKAYLRKIEM